MVAVDHGQAGRERLPPYRIPLPRMNPGPPGSESGASLRIYGSETSTENGSGPHTDDEDDDPIEEQYDYSTLFDAPSYSEFIKTAPNSKARSYEKRVQSMMKAGMIASLNNHQWADAATFLKHGPGFAKAAGNLAAEDARVAGMVELLTAPDSPYVMFAMVAIPLIAQLARNHQPEMKKAEATFRERRAERKQAKLSGQKPHAATPPITVRIFKREFKLPIRFRVKLPNLKNVFKAFLAPTQYPAEISAEVFNDENVIKALHKMGVFPRRQPEDDNNE